MTDGISTDDVSVPQKSLPESVHEASAARVAAMPEDDRIAATALAFAAVLANAREGGTFRYLIYDRLGFSPAAYVPLYYAGGMHISENFVLTDELSSDTPAVLSQLESLAKAAPMAPHPTLTRSDGSAVLWPTPERSLLFSAVHFTQVLLESNRALVEANKRLSLQYQQLEDAHLQTHNAPNVSS